MATTPMSWNDLPPDLRAIVEATLTPKELDAIKLTLNGAGYRRVSLALGIAPETARARLKRARLKLADHPDMEQYLARNPDAA